MKTKYVKVGQEGGYWLLTEGACSVKIYSSKQEKNGEVYETHSVYHVEAGKRVSVSFSARHRGTYARLMSMMTPP